MARYRSITTILIHRCLNSLEPSRRMLTRKELSSGLCYLLFAHFILLPRLGNERRLMVSFDGRINIRLVASIVPHLTRHANVLQTVSLQQFRIRQVCLGLRGVHFRVETMMAWAIIECKGLHLQPKVLPESWSQAVFEAASVRAVIHCDMIVPSRRPCPPQDLCYMLITEVERMRVPLLASKQPSLMRNPESSHVTNGLHFMSAWTMIVHDPFPEVHPKLSCTFHFSSSRMYEHEELWV